MLLSEAFRTGLIDSYYRQFFASKLLLCDCGCLLHITENLKKIHCVNTDCVNGKAGRLMNMCLVMEIQGYSSDSLKEIVKDVPFDGFVQHIFSESPGEPFLSMRDWLTNTPRTSGQLCGAMCFPGFKDNARKVFKNIPKVTYLVEMWNKHTVEEFIQIQLGKTLTAQHYAMVPIIMTYLNEIVTLLALARLKETSRTFYVVITDDITLTVGQGGKHLSKYEYIDYLNKIGGSYVSVEMNQAILDADYIINDVGFVTKKLLAGRGAEQRKQRRLVITSAEFVKIFKEEVAVLVQQSEHNTQLKLSNAF